MPGAVWLAVFVFYAITGATVNPPSGRLFLLLAAVGLVIFAWQQRSALWQLLLDQRWLFLALLGVSLGVAQSAYVWPASGQWAAVWVSLTSLPAQATLGFCLPFFTLGLADKALRSALMAVFALLCIWHVVAMPVEAIWGLRVGWHDLTLLARKAGPLNYQAAGLSAQCFFYVGLFLPMAYLVLGPLNARAMPGWPRLSDRGYLVLAALWLLPTVSVQSRSALFGASGAWLLVLATQQARQGQLRRVLWLMPLLLVAGALVYAGLFHGGKSGADLRLAYINAYLINTLNGPYLWTGQGFMVLDPPIRAAGQIALGHSHNDWVQMLFSAGLPTLLFYLAFWGFLARLIYRHFVVRGEYWPVCALLCVLPTMVTDLGFHLYEKAMFLMLLSGLCLAFARDDAMHKTPSKTRPEGF